MKQAIPGVTPFQAEEVTSMEIWPSICATSLGRFLGQLYSIRVGVGVVTVGNLIALASIPLALALYFYRLAPAFYGKGPHGVIYRLTNRRVVELRSEFRFSKVSFNVETRSVQLDRFDAIRIEVQPGQEWFHAGDLVFLQGDVETFRLAGVSRPEAFRASCIKAHASYVGVKKALERQAS